VKFHVASVVDRWMNGCMNGRMEGDRFNEKQVTFLKDHQNQKLLLSLVEIESTVTHLIFGSMLERENMNYAFGWTTSNAVTVSINIKE